MKNLTGLALAGALVVTGAGLASTAPAIAQAPAPEGPMPDEEERLDEGLKQFGYLTGLARGCVAEAQKTALEREAMDLNNSIGRLLGTDRAFLYSSSFGYGTTIKSDVKECGEILKNYDARVEKYRKGQGGSR